MMCCTSLIIGALTQVGSEHCGAESKLAHMQEKSLILLDELDKQFELDPSILAPLAKLVSASKVMFQIWCKLKIVMLPT